MTKCMFLDSQIEKSIEILKLFEPQDGYYLAFSGGKDSVVLLDLAKKSGVKFDAHYHITSADPPELVNFVKTFKEVSMDHPGTSLWKLIPKKLMPPTRRNRYCCSVLKECGGEGRVVITGVRSAESPRRKKQHRVSQCLSKNKMLVNPILDWSDDEVWEYIKTQKLRYCELYDQGFNRLGCIGCPIGTIGGRKKEFERWPKYKDAYIRAFDRMLKERIVRGKQKEPTKWKSAELVMEWWMSQ